MTSSTKARVLAFIAVLVVVFASACSVPRRTLSYEEKKADLYWLFSIFNENYAPLEYKEKRFSFNYETLKEKYLEDAKNTKSNDEFYDLMYRFVSEFKDAHTSASLTNSALPGRTKVAYLGFFGVRVKDTLVVTSFLPTMQGGNFPIHYGERVLKMDGVPLVDIIRNEMVNFRNLGQDEANLTYHMGNIFARVSTVNGQPKKDTAVVTVVRGGKEVDIVLPWIVKDLVQFVDDQRKAAAHVGDDYRKEETRDNAFYSLGFMALQKLGNGEMNFMPSFLQKITRKAPGFKFWNTFEFVDTMPTIQSATLRNTIAEAAQMLNLIPNKQALLRAGATPMDYLRSQRMVPWNVFSMEGANTYPAYVSQEEIYDADGKGTGQKKFVGYMYLDTFSPENDEDAVLAEVQTMLYRMQALGVKDLVIDTINNGGGSLSLGMKLAQLFSKDKVVMPDMQFKLSETWLDEFEQQSLGGATDLDRELGRRAYNLLKSEKDGGKKISSRFSAEALLPYQLESNYALGEKLNIVILVNEMCASMCDIFAGIMKDNKLATIMGSRSMGAGGNVVEHMFAPNTGLAVRQTESLIVSPSGEYIENNGVEPDVVVDVNAATLSRYSPVVRKAIKLLTTLPAPSAPKAM